MVLFHVVWYLLMAGIHFIRGSGPWNVVNFRIVGTLHYLQVYYSRDI